MNSSKIKLSVVIPSFNEVDNLAELVDRLTKTFRANLVFGEIIIVDDGSTDESQVILKKLTELYPCLVVVKHSSNKGIEEAWNSGLRISRGEYVCFMDADLENLPEDVARLYHELIFSKADVVQGYRNRIDRENDLRYYYSRFLNWLLNRLFRMHARDNKSGFLVGHKEVIKELLRHRFKYYYFQTFIGVVANVRGFSVREVETIFAPRLAGKSFISSFPLVLILKVLIDLAKAVIEFGLLKKKENILAEYLKSAPGNNFHKGMKASDSFRFKFYCFTMPIHKWQIRSNASSYYQELSKSQWLSSKELEEIQAQKLHALIHQAYYHVPFYRNRFEELGLEPSDIQSVADLSKIPLLSKQNVRDCLYHGLLSNNHNKKKILRISTSGSTGEPLIVYADRHQLEIRWAATLRGQEMTGYRFGDRQLRLWHQTIGMNKLQVIKEFLDARISRRVFIPAFEISESNFSEIISQIIKVRPSLIDGYAESLHLLATYLGERTLDAVGVRSIITSAQSLPEESRKIIERAFGCKVFNKYGSREFSGIAWECSAHQGLHIDSENYIVEILNNGKPVEPGETGEVVITDLNNYCMPLIRYRIGDLATTMNENEPCSCGRCSPKIKKIEGRIQSIIIAENGRYLPGTFFSHFFKDYDHLIRSYQVIQEQPGRILLRIIKGSRFSDRQIQKMLENLSKYVGKNITVEFPDSIPLSKTGKRHSVLSSLPIDYQKISGSMSD